MINKKHRAYKIRQVYEEIQKAQEDRRNNYIRQVEYDDNFAEFYGEGASPKILRPPYTPSKMYELYEESGPLSASTEAYVTNIVGYGYDIVPTTVTSEVDVDPQILPEKQKLKNFFEYPNEVETFRLISEQLVRDYVVTGNGYLEVIRNLNKEPSLLYWKDAKKVRLCPLDTEPSTVIEAKLPRNGKNITVTIQKKFRKFVTISGPDKMKLRYYKEYGDPRKMNALTGKYEEQEENNIYYENQPYEEATELIHWKYGNSAYGIPLWVSNILAALGGTRADFVNYDLFDSQGIPPFIITVAGGELSDDSFDDLLAFMKNAKGVENFWKVLLLQADSTMTNLEGKEAKPALQIQDMMSYRKNDVLFGSYLKDVRDTVRKFGFRLPGLYVGETDNISYASAKIARETTEDQVFVPLRKKFDELIKITLLKDLQIQEFIFKLRGPIIRSSEDLLNLLPVVVKSGVFTLNELIEFANTNFSTNIPIYEDDWANLPLPLILYFFQKLGIGGEPMLGPNEVFKPLTEGLFRRHRGASVPSTW
ncbi:MAG: phage portal protein [Candidatus Hodarchaeota archaeon]